MTSPKFCESCGTEIHEGAQFCGSCGHVVPGAASGAPAPEPVTEPPVAPAPAAATTAAVTPPPVAPPPTAPPGGGAGSRNFWLALLALVVVVGGGIAAAIALKGSDSSSSGDKEVLLESTASAGPSPFTPSIQPVAATTPTTATTIPPVTVPPVPGRVAQGPFGGTGDNTLCDRELLVQFLTTPSNAAIANEWARVIGIRVADIPAYVRALIPTTLTGDTRVTNHRWDNGRAVGYQAVLERGTAVLVDTNGALVARCRCGNPLRPPLPVAQPVYTGPKWPDFNPTVIVVVVQSPQPIYPPGGVGTLPPTTARRTTPTTRKPATTTPGKTTDADAASALVRKNLESCYRGLVGGGTVVDLSAAEMESLLATFTYTSSAQGTPGVYRVVVNAPTTGEFGTWDVTVRTGDIVPADPTAVSVGGLCPALA